MEIEVIAFFGATQYAFSWRANDLDSQIKQLKGIVFACHYGSGVFLVTICRVWGLERAADQKEVVFFFANEQDESTDTRHTQYIPFGWYPNPTL